MEGPLVDTCEYLVGKTQKISTGNIWRICFCILGSRMRKNTLQQDLGKYMGGNTYGKYIQTKFLFRNKMQN